MRNKKYNGWKNWATWEADNWLLSNKEEDYKVSCYFIESKLSKSNKIVMLTLLFESLCKDNPSLKAEFKDELKNIDFREIITNHLLDNSIR